MWPVSVTQWPHPLPYKPWKFSAFEFQGVLVNVLKSVGQTLYSFLTTGRKITMFSSAYLGIEKVTARYNQLVDGIEGIKKEGGDKISLVFWNKVGVP